jgi:hypothetical protein
MPSAEAALVSLLTTGSPNPVHALVGTRVYPRKLPQNVTYPAIRYTRISTSRSEFRTLDGRAGYARPRFQIDCYGLTEASCVALAQALYQLLEGFDGIAAGLRIDGIGTDDEGADVEEGVGPGGSDLFRQRLDFMIPHPE